MGAVQNVLKGLAKNHEFPSNRKSCSHIYEFRNPDCRRSLGSNVSKILALNEWFPVLHFPPRQSNSFQTPNRARKPWHWCGKRRWTSFKWSGSMWYESERLIGNTKHLERNSSKNINGNEWRRWRISSGSFTKCRLERLLFVPRQARKSSIRSRPRRTGRNWINSRLIA